MSIAVIIPCFEQEEYLDRCLASVLWQLAEGDSVTIVAEAGHHILPGAFHRIEQWPRVHETAIRVITNDAPRKGISYSRNFAIRPASDIPPVHDITKATWLKFLDADDVLAPFALESFRRLTIPETVQVISGEMYKVMEGRIHPEPFVTRWDVIARVNPSLVSTCFIRRSGFLKVGGFDEKIGFEEDWDLWLKLRAEFEVNGTFGAVSWPVCYYWIAEAERAAKVRDHSVEYQGARIDVREYFRRHYGVNPQ